MLSWQKRFVVLIPQNFCNALSLNKLISTAPAGDNSARLLGISFARPCYDVQGQIMRKKGGKK